MNISAKFNNKPSNECSDISVENTNVNFLLHTNSRHPILHIRKKKKNTVNVWYFWVKENT